MVGFEVNRLMTETLMPLIGAVEDPEKKGKGIEVNAFDMKGGLMGAAKASVKKGGADMGNTFYLGPVAATYRRTTFLVTSKATEAMVKEGLTKFSAD